MNKLGVLVAILVVALALTGCGGGGNSGGGGGGNPTLQSITVAGSPKIFLGDTQQFTATGHFSDGSTRTLTSATWSSSSTGAATISATGLATSAGVGTTTITASSSGINGTASLDVVAKLTSIAITPANPTIAQGTKQQFTATGTFNAGAPQDITSLVTWSSSDLTVATISNAGNNGTATAMASVAATTTITITATATGGTAASGALTPATLAPATNLTVTNATLISIAVTPATQTIGLGTQQQFTAIGTFSDATTQDVTNSVNWSSNKTGVAAITVSGLATGKGLGAATITAKAGATSGTATLTVDASSLVSIAVTPNPAQIALTTTVQMKAKATFLDGSTLDITTTTGIAWSSSITTFATVQPGNGLAVSVAPGTTTITATLGGISGTAPLTVTSATLTSIAVAPSSTTIAPATKQTFTAVGTFTDATTQNISALVTWASDNPAAATISNTVGSRGVATAVALGTCNITAAFNGVTSPGAPLTVSGATLTAIDVNPVSFFIPPSSVVQYAAVGHFSDGSSQFITQTVTWASDDTNVATVNSSGAATGQGGGSAHITATLSGVTGTANLLVTASPLVSLAITPTNGRIAAQTELLFTATGTFQDGSSQNLTGTARWTSSNGLVATISNTGGSNGLAVGVGAGTSTIGANIGTVVAPSVTLTVTNATLVSIAITPANPTISRGQNQQFTATGTFSDATTQNLTNQVTWSSSSPGVAVVNATGFATTAGTGTTTISAAFGSVTGQTVLTVN